jgi:PAS domain S-box-containing protein
MLFTRSYAASPVAVVMRLDSPFLVSMQDLRHLRLAGNDRSVTTEYLRTHRPDLQLETFPGTAAAAKAVASGRADAMVEGLIPAATTIQELGLENLKVAGIVDLHFDLCVAVRQDWPLACELLDHAVAADPPEVRNERFDRWLSAVLGLQRQAWRWRGLVRAAVAAGALILLIGVGVALWNSVLRRRVTEATESMRKQMASRLESELRFQAIYDHAPLGMFRSRPDDHFISVNPFLARLLDYDSPEQMVEEVNQRGISHSLFEVPAQRNEVIRDVLDHQGVLVSREVTYRTRSGRLLLALLSITALNDPVDHEPTLVGFVQDITERRRDEQGRQHRDKLMALGQLAGGVAHDFNNLLMVIQASAERLSEDHSENKQVSSHANRIVGSVQLASGLSSRLLQFARRNTDVQRVYDAHDAVRNALKLFASVGGRYYAVEEHLASGVAQVWGSPGLLQNAVLNLCINARDAMQRGGSVKIESREIEVGPKVEPGWTPADLSPGRYLHLSLHDSGEGMSPEVLARCHEPFFTTKGDSGTGLGLAMVASAVVEHQGALRIDSVLGHGTTVHLLLRLAENPPTEPVA